MAATKPTRLEMEETDLNLVEIDGKFYKEAQHITTGDRKLLNAGNGPQAWIVSKPADVHGRTVQICFHDNDGGTWHKVWSVGQIIQLEVAK